MFFTEPHFDQKWGCLKNKRVPQLPPKKCTFKRNLPIMAAMHSLNLHEGSSIGAKKIWKRTSYIRGKLKASGPNVLMKILHRCFNDFQLHLVRMAKAALGGS